MSEHHLLLAGAIEDYETGHDPPASDEHEVHEVIRLMQDCSITNGLRFSSINAAILPGSGYEETSAHVFYCCPNTPPATNVFVVKPSITKPGELILDSAAGVTVINELSCANLESYCPISDGVAGIAGVGGEKTPTRAFVSLKEPFGCITAHYVPGAVANIMSQPDVQESYYTTFVDQKTPRDRVVISEDPEGNTVVAQAFKSKESRYYTVDYTDPNETAASKEPPRSHVLNVFRDAHSRGMSKNQIERAMRAKSAHRAFSYISLRRLKDLLKTHGYGFDITPDDISAYERLHDTDCLSCQLGKTTRSDQVTLDVSKATRPGEKIICDILEIKSKKLKTKVLIIISVDEYSAYVHTRFIAKKDLKNVIDSLKYIVDDYRSFGWKVDEIALDGDGAFKEMALHLAEPLGVRVIPTSPDKHAVVAERMIRTLTTLFRCTLAGLPYVLAPHLFANMLDYCASSNNLIPNSHNPMISPTELFTKRSPEHHKLSKIEYGKLVTFYHPTTKNDEFRARVGIIVGRDVRRPGHAIIWDLINGGALARNDFKTVEWNQALLKAYIDAAMASHESHGAEVPRAVYYEATDIVLSGEDLEKLVDDPHSTIASIRGQATEVDSDHEGETNRNLDIWQNKQSMQRLRDMESASAQNLSLPSDEELPLLNEEELRLPNEEDDEDRDDPKRSIFQRGHEEYLSYKRARDQHPDPHNKSNEIPGPNSNNESAEKFKAWSKQAQDNLKAGFILPSRSSKRYATVFNLTVKEASTKINRAETIKALLGEFNQMGDKDVWAATTRQELKELYRLGRVKNILSCSVFLKEKFDADKKFLKLKARLVVHGNRQIMDELFGAKDIDSPTVSLATVNILLHMAAAGGWHKRVADVAGAYLNAELTEPEYMKIPRNIIDILSTEFQPGTFDEFLQDDGSIVVKLKKALYGLKQSGRAWYELLSKFLIEQGYVRSEVDKCLFSKIQGDHVTHVAIYVDDLLMAGNDQAEIESLTTALRDRFKEITVQEGANISFVGMEIQTMDNGDIRLRQRGYITDVIKHFGVLEHEFEIHPCSGNIMSAASAAEADCDVTKYKSGVMKLMYLSTRTRPDIAFVVSALASRAENPKTSDWSRLLHVTKFLNKTKDDFLTYKYGGDINISAFVDASFMTHRDMRSHTGYCIFADRLGSAAIAYRSVKQKTVADSSTEAEVIALHELVQHLLWILSIYESMGVHFNSPVDVHNDNEAAIRLNSQEKVNFKGRSKYIARKFFSIFEHVEEGKLRLLWTGTDDLVADFLTKAITGGKFTKFRIKIGFSQDDVAMDH